MIPCFNNWTKVAATHAYYAAFVAQETPTYILATHVPLASHGGLMLICAIQVHRVRESWPNTEIIQV